MSNQLLHKRKIFKPENWKIRTIPNILTFIRMGVIPFLVLTFFFKYPLGSFLPLGMFIFASLTDYADGYIARKFQQSSKLGSFLDPIADKLLVSTTLLMMAGTGRIGSINLIPAVIILCREFIISGLREFLAATGQELQVSKLAKYKTMLQMMAITCLLADLTRQIFLLGSLLLWISAFLTVITGIAYIKISFAFIRNK